MYCSIVEQYQITNTFMLYYKRIIYCLYFKDNFFYLSRNFRLQKVGDLNWLIKNFGFGSKRIRVNIEGTITKLYPFRAFG